MGTDATLDRDELEEVRGNLSDDIFPDTQHPKPDLDVDGLETSVFARLRKYFDPKNR